MRSKGDANREMRLAAALKENLKRRKAQAKAKAKPHGGAPVRTFGTAPQAGLEGQIAVPKPPQSKNR